MEESLKSHEQRAGGNETESEIKRQIFEKVRRKMSELGYDVASPFKRFQPDVVIVPADQVIFLEPQNWRVTQWLHERCGLSLDKFDSSEKIPVHPCQRSRIIADLKAAGFEVVC